MRRVLDPPLPLKPSEEMGAFRMGSTVVLLMDVPRGFQFSVGAGQKVCMGQALAKRRWFGLGWRSPPRALGS